MIYYLIIMNLLGFGIMFYDKNKAKKYERRISEKTLFRIAIFGGSLGIFSGMYTFRHKTKHSSFIIGIPIIIAIQIVLIYKLLTLDNMSNFLKI